MPIPLLVPVAIGIVTLATSGAGVGVTVKASKRKKQAKERYKERYGSYEAKFNCFHGKCEQINEKLAALSLARMEAYSTLGDATIFLKQSGLGKQGKTEQFGITSDMLDDLQERSGIAAEALGALSGVGIGVAGVSAAWTAAGLGTASTGTAIAGLSGVAEFSAKLALLGGGAKAAAGGGMLLGGLMLGILPIGPALLITGFVSLHKVKKYERVVEEAIAEIDAAEYEMECSEYLADLVSHRIRELTDATSEIDRALRQLLAQSSPQNQSDVRTVATATSELARILDIAIIDKNGNILNEEQMASVYHKHSRGARQQDLKGSYDLLRESVATLDYQRVESLLKHVSGVIKI